MINKLALLVVIIVAFLVTSVLFSIAVVNKSNAEPIPFITEKPLVSQEDEQLTIKDLDEIRKTLESAMRLIEKQNKEIERLKIGTGCA